MKLLGSAGARQGFWSMADQGAVSLGNFLTSILLARRLAPAEYGIYALLLATVFVLNSVQAAVITYPVSLEGAAESESDLQRRAGGSLVLTMLLAVALTAVLVVATFVLKRPAIWPYAAVALICWQAQETARRALMTHGRHREALWGDVLSYVGQAILVGLLLLWHGITLESARRRVRIGAGHGAAGCGGGGQTEYPGRRTGGGDRDGAALARAVGPEDLAVRRAGAACQRRETLGEFHAGGRGGIAE